MHVSFQLFVVVLTNAGLVLSQVYYHAPPEIIIRRLGGKQRFLAVGEDVEVIHRAPPLNGCLFSNSADPRGSAFFRPTVWPGLCCLVNLEDDRRVWFWMVHMRSLAPCFLLE